MLKYCCKQDCKYVYLIVNFIFIMKCLQKFVKKGEIVLTLTQKKPFCFVDSNCLH